MVSRALSTCYSTLAPSSSVLSLRQRPFGRVSGLGRSAHPCLQTRPLHRPSIDHDVKARAATTATLAPSSPAEPPKGQVTFDLEINAHQPVNVLDVPGIDATFPLYLDIQLASEQHLTTVISTNDWRATTSTGTSHGVEMKGITWKGSITADAGFGTPGALLITKTQATPKERLTLYISTVDVTGSGITFDCHSTVASEQGQRIFFAGTPQLPTQTKGNIKELRETELQKLRGEDPSGPDPEAERVDTDRIYDYQDYSDLGAPWKGPTWSRPTLGGKELPFPRRLRSNRPTWVDDKGQKTDFETAVKDPNPLLSILKEMPPNCPYLPLDEQWNNTKERGFIGSAAAAVLGNVQAQLKTLAHDASDGNASFVSLHAVDSMYQKSQLPKESRRDGSPFKFDDKFISSLQQGVKGLAAKLHPGSAAVATAIKTYVESTAAHFLRSKVLSWPKEDILDKLTTFPVPKIRDGRSLDCFTDAEFGRQLVAGQHPCTIQAATKEWLTQPDLQPLRDADIDGFLEGKSLQERIDEGGRMFCVDYVPGFLDYMDKIDNQNKDTEKDKATRPDFFAKDRKQHAGRALLYYADEGYLKPVAIQLIVDPKDPKGTAYSPNDHTELWTLAKAIFGNLDFLYHQAASHYLIGHACQEPYIIALMRHVSAMHPVYKLMRPHFRNTLHVNAFGRVILTNAGAPIEALLTTGEYGMRLDSYIYDKVWSFDKSNFETDLISRGMVEMEDGEPKREDDGRVIPSIDYPFAEDGLDIWYAMHKWFSEYLGLYYNDDKPGEQVVDDEEIVAFWKEVQDKGHPDKASGWIELTDIASLTDILTTIAFNGSVHHTAVNFGNYDYSGYSPVRPSIVRKAMPKNSFSNLKDDADAIDALKYNFEKEFLSYLTQPQDAMQIATVFRVLSVHAENEEYLDSNDPEWIRDPNAKGKLDAFVAAMNDLDKKIVKRTSESKSKMGSDVGSRYLPYEILRPNSSAGMTGRGVPYSTSI